MSEVPLYSQRMQLTPRRPRVECSILSLAAERVGDLPREVPGLIENAPEVERPMMVFSSGLFAMPH